MLRDPIIHCCTLNIRSKYILAIYNFAEPREGSNKENSMLILHLYPVICTHSTGFYLFAHSHSCGNFLIALGDPFVKSCGLYILVDENDNLRVELSTLLN